MSKIVGSLSLLILAMLAVLPAVPAEGEPATATETDRAFDRAAAERDWESFRSMIAEEALTFGAAVSHGREQVAAGFAPFFDEASGATLRWSPKLERSSGDLAYTVGEYTMTRSEGGKEIVGYGIYVSIWRRAADGSWLLELDTGTPPAEQPLSLAPPK